MYYDTLGSSTLFDYQGFIDEFLVIFTIIEIVSIILGILSAICLWKMFKKAGYPAWSGVIPFYNTYIFFVKLHKNLVKREIFYNTSKNFCI